MVVKVLGYALLIWSLFTIITPFFAYQGLWWLILIRILMGLGEGVTFPLGMQYMLDGFHFRKEQEL